MKEKIPNKFTLHIDLGKILRYNYYKRRCIMQDQNISMDKLCLDGRKKLSMSGVEAVDGFSEQFLKLSVGKNKVTIIGENIKITAFNKALGTLSADGDFIEIKYGVKKDAFIKRIFK